jgi:hypothetical protein
MQFSVRQRWMGAVAGAMLCFAATSPAVLPPPQGKPILAKSATDERLQTAIRGLGPNVLPREAAAVTQSAYDLGRELRKRWAVVWPPGLQNFLVHKKVKKGGLCYEWADELLLRLNALNLQSIELHWAEAEGGTRHEHNVIVVTAKGQPFMEGILLDNWRFGGRLAWGTVRGDYSHHPWLENREYFAYALNEKFRRPPVSKQRPTAKAAAPPATATQRSAQR